MAQPCSEFHFTGKIKLFFYEVNRHFTLEEYKIPLPENLRHVDEGAHAFTPDPIPFDMNPDLFEIVDRHDRADFIVFPYSLFSLIYRSGIFGDTAEFRRINNPNGNARVLEFLKSLPYFGQSEERHLFFSGHDWEGPYGVRCTIINNSVSKLNGNPNMISMPYFMEDTHYHPEDKRILYVTNFVGNTNSHEVREELVKSLETYNRSGGRLPIYLTTSSVHFAHLPEEEKQARRVPFLDAMYRSVTSLCPRGAGLNSERLFETMSMGRIPILISDNCTLPLEDVIDWDSCILRIAEGEVKNIGKILEDYMARTDNGDLKRMCLKNRLTWEKFFQPSQKQFLYYMGLQKVLASL